MRATIDTSDDCGAKLELMSLRSAGQTRHYHTVLILHTMHKWCLKQALFAYGISQFLRLVQGLLPALNALQGNLGRQVF